ncbi:type IV pili twitching motility protein PilT [Enterobacterales bacterium CwR94]|nr:type IV pili twitching motility protein PilT [Enterobacterales bacterium CwR94]
MDIAEMVALSVKQNASDLHLCSGHLPQWRCQGRLQPIPERPILPPEQLQQWAHNVLDSRQQAQLKLHGHVDFALSLPAARVRANLFCQQQGLSLALRPLPGEARSLETLDVPAAVKQALRCEEGLILVTGATGSGKSTTLTAMIDHLNRTQALHIITLEDPIEFQHRSDCALIQQREINEHCASFQQGLLAALREDPDVILLGELRDVESIRLALTAAETGHLVLATLHARHAAQAIDRLVEVFPAQEKAFARLLLAGSLRAVIAQRLVPAAQDARVALYEVLLNTPAVANLIREDKVHQLPALMESGQRSGMQTFAQSLAQRQREGWL